MTARELAEKYIYAKVCPENNIAPSALLRGEIAVDAFVAGYNQAIEDAAEYYELLEAGRETGNFIEKIRALKDGAKP